MRANAAQAISADYTTIERVARRLADDRFGAGHFDRKGTKRGYWRRKARKLIERERRIALADALMGIFGLRRVG
jgi:hypothetical protein